jgi:hypothetical protein
MLRSSFRFRQAKVALAEPYASALQHAPQCLRTAAWQEANNYRWYEGERLGRDPGDQALKEWFRKHWLPFCRSKRLEHVEGQQQWDEFAEDEFGQVYAMIVSGDLLLDRILDRMEEGADNLEVLIWAQDWGLDMERVLELLLLIDINRARLEPIAFPEH